MQYEIYEGNMERLKTKLTRIANKCKKYGCDFHYAEVGETFKPVKDDKGILHDTRFVIVEAEGTAKINDWEFAATIDHTEAGNIITGYGIEIPERYYTAPCTCEHCNSRRYRKETYVVHNVVSGEFKQVGKSCLADYTHGLSAEGVAHYLSFFDTLVEYEAPDSAGGFTHYLDKMEYLIFAAETIRCFGYVKRGSNDYDTASRAMDCYDAYYHRFPFFMKEFEQDTLTKMEQAGFNPEKPETLEMVNGALEWVKNQEESSNYIHNLKTACALNYIKYEHYGLLASLFPAYNRELEYQAKKEREKKAEQVSNYVGEIKQRLTVKILSCKAVASWETEFGTTKIYKMVDEAGNIFVWKTGNWIEEESFIITGTVKEHKEFHGIKQTELTRCRIQAA